MKFPFLSLAMLLALATLSSQAIAQSAYVSIEERLTADQLRSVGLSDEQLAKLNRMLRDAQEGQGGTVASSGAMTAVAAAPADSTSRPVAAAPASANVGGPASSDTRGRDEGSLIGFNDKPIQSRLKGSVSGWEPGTVFELENGQQWKVLKGALKLPKTLDAPDILVVPGVAGRWFLQVVDGMPKARVYRID